MVTYIPRIIKISKGLDRLPILKVINASKTPELTGHKGLVFSFQGSSMPHLRNG